MGRGIWFADHYVLHARAMPALFVSIPVIAAAFLFLPLTLDKWGTVLALMASCGAFGFISVQVSGLGNKRQRKLFDKWGGTPTSLILSHSNDELNPHTKARYHRNLESLIPGLVLPNADHERADPESAAWKYDDAVNYLLEVTRDKEQFPLVYQDNVQYGFTRNLFALRGLGLFISAIGLLFSSVPFIMHLFSDLDSSWSMTPGFEWTGAVICIASAMLGMLLLVLVTEDAVAKRAFRYARSLVGATDLLVKVKRFNNSGLSPLE